MKKIGNFFKVLLDSIAESQRLRAEYMIKTVQGRYPLSEADRKELFRH